MELSAEIGALTKVSMGSHQDNDRSSRNSSSGSSTSEKSRMLDITRDKPVKVAVRVAVPVRDHPKFNFVGKLLGPKGNSMKRLQEETMCKMAVLGRGSMKDRKKEEELRLSGDPRYSHLLEDLHVEISTFAAPAEAHARIAYALSEVRRFLVPDYYDDIRQEQMWEMQALNTTQTPLDSSNSILNCGILSDPNFLATASPTSGLGTNCSSTGTSDSNHQNISCDQQSIGSESTVNSKNCENIMQIDVHHNGEQNLGIPNTQLQNNGNISTSCATTIAANPLNSYNIQGLNGPPNMTSSMVNNHNNSSMQHMQNGGTINAQANNDIEPKTVTLFESPLLHPALRGVKTVNIANGLARKRPLLGVPRSNMNPTKRTVMTLLARARNAQALYNARAGLAAAITEPIQMITSPLILQPQLDVIQHANGSMSSIPKENILQGA